MGEMAKLSAQELAALREQIKSANPDKDSLAAGGGVNMSEFLNKKYTVVIAADRMSATLTLSDPGEGVSYSTEEVMSELRKNKIMAGIDSDAVMRMISKKVYEEPVVVAVGKEMIPPQEGYYEFLFDTVEHKTPAIREDGTTDYSAVGRLENVKTGQKIAIYHPAVQGSNGYDVGGRELVAKFAKELPDLRGMKIEKNSETNEYFAKIDGKISLKEYNVEILDVHEINDNVTLVQGKVEFYGDLYINGDVEAGVVIRAGRNVVINGTVGAVTIYAGGDVILSKGIQGSGRGYVATRGNVFSDFIEYARVEAGADVYANSIINSEVSAGGNVVVSGKRGSIIGGETYGLRGVIANAAGNVSEIKTTLRSGFAESDYKEFVKLSVDEKNKNDELVSVVEKITAILKLRAKNGFFTNEQKRDTLSLKEKKDLLCEELKNIAERKTELGRKMTNASNSSITIRGAVYRNVLIGIDVARLWIEKEESYVQYVCKNDMIERRPVPRQ